MGGSIGMTLGLKFHRDVAGVFALSSYLTHHSAVYKVHNKRLFCYRSIIVVVYSYSTKLFKV